MDLIKQHTEGLQENKVHELKKIYAPMFHKLEEFEERFNEVVEMEINPVTIEHAKKLRLEIRKVRTTGEKARKEAQAEVMTIGRAIDGVFNTLKYAVESKEQKLMDIEKHYENLRLQEIKNLQDERALELIEYTENIPPNLGEMEEGVWFNFFTGARSNYQAQKEPEEKER